MKKAHGLFAALLVVGLGGSPIRAEEKPDRAAELKAIKDSISEFMKERAKVSSREEFQKLVEKYDPPKLLERLTKLARDDQKDAAGGEAVLFLAGNSRSTADVPKWLEKVADTNVDKDLRGRAAFKLASLLQGQAERLSDKDPESAKERDALLAKADMFFDRVARKYADVKDEEGPIGPRAETLRNLAIGKVAPDFEIETLAGKKVKLSDFRGKVLVLDIWATWCGPCRAMIPHERELVKRLEGQPFLLVSISADSKKETLEEFLKKTPMPWEHWFAGQDGKLLRDWNVQFFPTIYVLDHKGVIRFKGVRGKDMDQAVETLLKDTPGAKPIAEKKSDEPAGEK